MPDIIEEAWKRRQQEQRFQQQQKKDNDTIKKTLNTSTIPLHKVKGTQRDHHFRSLSLTQSFAFYSVPGYQWVVYLTFCHSHHQSSSRNNTCSTCIPNLKASYARCYPNQNPWKGIHINVTLPWQELAVGK